MYYTKQDDYDNFRCIAGKCPSSCCKGWSIVIDNESLEKYSKIEGPFANRLMNSIDDSGCFRQYNGRCVMLNDDDYCDLQLSLGENMLCNTCGMFPRHVEEFDGVRELSLSLSCPQAAEMLIKRNTYLDFISFENEEDEPYEDDYDEFDYMLYSELVDARVKIISILKEHEVSLSYNFNRILTFASLFQNSVNNGDYIDITDLYEKASQNPNIEWDFFEAKNDFSLLFSLENLDSNWPSVVEMTWNYYFTGSTDNFNDLKAFFDTIPAEKTSTQFQHDISLLPGINIALQLIFTYLCGSVYDYMIYSKIALSINFVRWSYMIAFAMGEGLFSTDTFIKIVYSLAKELEHSDENLITIDNWFDI